ncbi:TetR/AcrR family transcriptional regulator [uncultured Flavobacterium sp.]|uniref:TetR/AcrR family transcriptional regulator n=1 Tax=uncultured Flavobacterium sp. TaxID=165435 RepID=UPI0030ECF96C|tara:strand:- start:660 stop:1244 length:585 start_codon:yes stop_codon:yes gene_type:complete
MKEEIIQKALNHFLKNGSKVITMDDIAHEFGLSKKTLYDMFENKEALINDAVDLLWKDYLNDVNDILKTTKNPIQKTILIYERAIAIIITVEPVFIVSLRKYHNKVMSKYSNNRSDLINNIVLPLLMEAKSQNQIESTINLVLFCAVNFKEFDERIWKNFFFDKYSKEEILEYFIIRRLRGILSKDYLYLAQVK